MKHKSFILITSLMLFCSSLWAEGHKVACGSWIELAAHPMPDYHFVEWNDGNKEPVRSIQVHEDFTYIAYFAANCEEYANWPITSTAHNQMPMVDVWKINELGYYFTPEDVEWYRVVGEPDDMHNNFPQDDQLVVKGSCYLALKKRLEGSYYAVIDVSNSQGMLCDGLMRSVIINYSFGASTDRVLLLPNIATAGQEMTLIRLNSNEVTTIVVYNSVGQLIENFTSTGSESFILKAQPTAGCYLVKVTSKSLDQTLRYIVKGK